MKRLIILALFALSLFASSTQVGTQKEDPPPPTPCLFIICDVA